MTTLDRQWQKAFVVLSSHEKLLEEDILPENKIVTEMIQDFRNQIRSIRLRLLRTRRNPNSLFMIELSLNSLGSDLYEAGNLSGLNIETDIHGSGLKIHL